MERNADAGIAQVQTSAAQNKSLGAHHRQAVSYMDDRIAVYFFMLTLVLVGAAWMTSSSPYLTYGSLTAITLITILWGFIRIRGTKNCAS
ncbi:MAG: hypothetical protein GY935_17710 [Gammaproteobacteria bacterium]|nr:hypothetical protein [Gammaproteobacteria bacterium]